MTTPSFVTQVRRPDEEEESEYDGGITGTIEGQINFLIRFVILC